MSLRQAQQIENKLSKQEEMIMSMKKNLIRGMQTIGEMRAVIGE